MKYCRVKDSSGQTRNSVSAVVKINASLRITEQPKDQTISLGNRLTVSVKAQGKGLSYQWYHKKIGNSSWTVWTGRTHATETVTPNETWNGMQLYCKVTDSSGKTVGSSVAVITVSADTDPDEMPVG